MYFRYLDHIWILWDQDETQFQTFFDILNTHSPLREKINRHFWCNSFQRAVFYPWNTFTGIIHSLITRFYRICSEKAEFENAFTVLFKPLWKRVYSRCFLWSIKRETLANIKIGNSLNSSFNHDANTDTSSTQCEQLIIQPHLRIFRTTLRNCEHSH